jgi:hypothetical protein
MSKIPWSVTKLRLRRLRFPFGPRRFVTRVRSEVDTFVHILAGQARLVTKNVSALSRSGNPAFRIVWVFGRAPRGRPEPLPSSR